MTNLFDRELKTYEQHRPELVARALGKYALIHGDDVAGVFEAHVEAYNKGIRLFGLQPFLVRQIREADMPVRLPHFDFH